MLECLLDGEASISAIRLVLRATSANRNSRIYIYTCVCNEGAIVNNKLYNIIASVCDICLKDIKGVAFS